MLIKFWFSSEMNCFLRWFVSCFLPLPLHFRLNRNIYFLSRFVRTIITPPLRSVDYFLKSCLRQKNIVFFWVLSRSQKSRTQDTAGGIIRQRRCRTQDNEGRSRQSRLSTFNADAMDKVKGGVSYPPNLADAKEETPNETSAAYHAGTVFITIRQWPLYKIFSKVFQKVNV